MLDALFQAENDPSCKVVIFNAKGAFFCAGADLGHLLQLQSFSMEENLTDASTLAELYHRIYKSTKVCIAAVEGHALSVGCGLVTACDFAFAVPEALLGFTEVRLGFTPTLSISYLLRKVGETRAKEMLLSGDPISASQAEQYNLITRVLPAYRIRQEVLEYAQRLCMLNAAGSMQLVKRMIADVQDFPLENSIKLSIKMNAHVRGSAEFQRGMLAMINGENLQW